MEIDSETMNTYSSIYSDEEDGFYYVYVNVN